MILENQGQLSDARQLRINATIASHIERGTRLITIEGPIGSGKTEVVEKLVDLGYPIWRFATEGSALADDTDLGDVEAWVQAVQGRAVLVVESAGKATTQNMFDDLIGLLLRHEKLVLVFVSRVPTDIAIQTIDTMLYPATLGPDQLGYTEGEISELAVEAGVTLPGKVADVLLGFSGWKFSVDAAVENAVKETAGQTHDRLVEELSRQILQRVGSRLRGQTLTAAAICGFVDDGLLARFLERPEEQVRVEVTALQEMGLLTSGRAPVEDLRSGFEIVASQQWSDADSRDLLRTHATLVADSDPARAAHIRSDLRDYAALEQVLHDWFPKLVYAGLTDSTEQSLALKITQLPFEEVVQFPFILAYQLKLSALDERTPELDQQRLAEQILQLLDEAEQNEGGSGAVAAAVRLIAARKSADQDILTNATKNAQVTLVTGGPEAWSPSLRSFLLSELASGYVDLELPEEARRYAARAFESATGDKIQQAYASLQMSLLYAYLLDANASAQSFKRAQELVADAAAYVPELFWQVGIIGLVVLTSLHVETADFSNLGRSIRGLS